jgi:hypothetical protein
MDYEEKATPLAPRTHPSHFKGKKAKPESGPTTLEEARQECAEKGHKKYALAQAATYIIYACTRCDYYTKGRKAS